jgi:hypothetical protein
MNTARLCSSYFFKLLFLAAISGAIAATGPAIGASRQSDAHSVDAGYSALRLFLEDEQHLTTIRRIKTVITFNGVSDKTAKLIDQIADTSEQALEELDQLATAKPVIVFQDFDEDSIGKATLDSMRYTTAREFLFDSEDFEKSLLLSQSQILPVISHLARQLEQSETNAKRKAWLNKLAKRYEEYYRKVYARIAITA